LQSQMKLCVSLPPNALQLGFSGTVSNIAYPYP
jgi:hypothetical protein